MQLIAETSSVTVSKINVHNHSNCNESLLAFNCGIVLDVHSRSYMSLYEVFRIFQNIEKQGFHIADFRDTQEGFRIRCDLDKFYLHPIRTSYEIVKEYQRNLALVQELATEFRNCDWNVSMVFHDLKEGKDYLFSQN